MRIPRAIWCGTLSLLVLAADLKADDSEPARRSLLLRIQYIATDYRGAVAEVGRVTDEREFAENVTTAREAATSYRRLRPDGSLVQPIDHLATLVESKADPSEVERSAAQIVPALRQEFGLPPAPLYFPDLAIGAAAFAKHCASCHGALGRGDGPAATGLTPAPRSLADPDWADRQSPFQIFNTASVGIPGTSMSSFAGQTDDSTRWAIAFHVLTLRPPVVTDTPRASRPWIGVTELSLKSNRQLSESLKASGIAPEMALTLADAARRSEPPPLTLTEAMSRLRESAVAAVGQRRAGHRDNASDILDAAYYDAVEPVEPALAEAAPSHLPLLEMRVTELRDAFAGNRDPEPALRGLLAEIEELLRVTESGRLTGTLRKVSP